MMGRIPSNQKAEVMEIRKGHAPFCEIGLRCIIIHQGNEQCSTNTMQCTCGVQEP